MIVTAGTDPVSDDHVVRVVRWLRHPHAIKLAMDWPHLAALFGDGIDDAIRDVIGNADRPLASPLRVGIDGKSYLLPGNVPDMIDYVSAVVACLPAIGRSLHADQDRWDLGPPSLPELRRGECGPPVLMWSHWNRLAERVRLCRAAGDAIVHADVRRCFSSIDRDRLLRRLDAAGADARGMERLDSLLKWWSGYGGTGLPLVFASWPLIKLALLGVDDGLRARGVRFLRMGDDYRLICGSEAEERQGIEALAESLAAEGLELSLGKSWVEHPGRFADSLQRGRRVWWGRLKLGVARPILAESLRWRWLQPVALPLLAALRPRPIEFSPALAGRPS